MRNFATHSCQPDKAYTQEWRRNPKLATEMKNTRGNVSVQLEGYGAVRKVRGNRNGSLSP